MTELSELRRQALGYLVLAGKDRYGRRYGDPVFEDVTEGRQAPVGGKYSYSSCADLAHWLLFRLGFRFSWINREEAGGWVSQVNLNRLTASGCGGSNPLAVRAETGMTVAPGDVLVTHVSEASRSHVVLVCSEGPLNQGVPIVCAEYGQSDEKYMRPCGRLSVRSNWRDGAAVDSILRLERLWETSPVDAAPSAWEYAHALVERQPALERSSRGLRVRWWCETLAEHRFDPGLPLDIFGPKAEAATQQFRALHALDPAEPFNDSVQPECWLAALAYEGPRQ